MSTDFEDQDTGELSLPPPPIESLIRYATAVHPSVDVAGMTHSGKVRTRNEDSYLLVQYDRALKVLGSSLPESAMPTRYDELGYGMLVADGMGGMAAGDVASRMAIQTLVALALATPDWVLRGGDAEYARVIERLIERYRKIDSAVREEAMVNPEYTGMGTTLTVALNLGTRLFVGHVGDSRAYLFRNENLHRLTRDHTMAQVLADLDKIPASEVATHHFRHVLTRFVGGGKPVLADVMTTDLQDGDQVLVCTDGLTEMLPDPAIAATLHTSPSAQQACQALVNAALEQGGKDNVTAVVARYHVPKAI